jgi:hypothetical protein
MTMGFIGCKINAGNIDKTSKISVYFDFFDIINRKSYKQHGA